MPSSRGGANNLKIVCAKARVELTLVAAEKVIQRADFAAAIEGSRRHEVLDAPPCQPRSSPASRKHAGGAALGSIR